MDTRQSEHALQIECHDECYGVPLAAQYYAPSRMPRSPKIEEIVDILHRSCLFDMPGPQASSTFKNRITNCVSDLLTRQQWKVKSPGNARRNSSRLTRRRRIYPAPPQDDGQHAHELSMHPTQQRLALWKDLKWPGNGVRFRVAFIDKPTPPIELQKRVVSHMNAWPEFSNVRSTLIDDYIAAEARVSFSGKVLGKDDGGAWSYVRKQVAGITDRRKPTMMLTGFNMRTPEKAHTRTVQHETGHTLMHEHLRPELVERIDREKTIEEYSSVWDRKTIVDNIPTPLWIADNSHAILQNAILKRIAHDRMRIGDLRSKVMKEPPITGGRNFSEYNKKYAAEVYPIPKYEARVISEDKETIGIAAVGRQLYLRLLTGEIRAIFEQTNGQLKTHNLGEVDDPFNTKLHGSGLLYRVENGYKVLRWDGVTSGNIKGTSALLTFCFLLSHVHLAEWTVINKKADNIQIDARDGVVCFRDEAGMVIMYDKWRSRAYPLTYNATLWRRAEAVYCVRTLETTSSGKGCLLDLFHQNTSLPAKRERRNLQDSSPGRRSSE
ncbi:hypothetical protein PQX77_008413 [Marasmius sp. AFHP31]|nr:hypothetical protein PQX77_013026 [Marasmius sp. AFHP31]KAK1228548.1 hypothetical protein PQX77_008413 [Marasmius sp. AFHP31]